MLAADCPWVQLKSVPGAHDELNCGFSVESKGISQLFLGLSSRLRGAGERISNSVTSEAQEETGVHGEVLYPSSSD